MINFDSLRKDVKSMHKSAVKIYSKIIIQYFMVLFGFYRKYIKLNLVPHQNQRISAAEIRKIPFLAGYIYAKLFDI